MQWNHAHFYKSKDCFSACEEAKTNSQAQIKWTRGPGQSRDREAPLKALSATGQRFTSPHFNFAEAPVKNVDCFFVSEV